MAVWALSWWPSGPGTADDPDADLLAGAQAGQVQAATELTRRHYLRVFRFILRQVLNPADAEDLVQETFLEAHRRLSSFRGAAKYSTWVMGIAQNLVRNHFNRGPSSRLPSAPLDEIVDLLASNAPDPEEGLAARDQNRALLEALGQGLSPEWRQALVLVTLEGLSYEQAAGLLDVPVGTVKTRVFRARQRLRQLLARQGHEPAAKEEAT
ncbi:MAG: sigma-70 family RNA polymerase sigma factor [Magnetococcus sp. WYHC-3]